MSFKSGDIAYYKGKKVKIVKMPKEQTKFEKGNAVYVRLEDSNDTVACSLSDLSETLE